MHELIEVFGVEPTFDRPDELYDALSAQLARPEFRPRALFERFGIEILATTDSPLSDLAAHARLAKDGFEGRIVPTFRPDALVHVDRPGWSSDVAQLGRADRARHVDPTTATWPHSRSGGVTS